MSLGRHITALAAISLVAAVLVACGGDVSKRVSHARLRGHFIGMAHEKIFLERVLPEDRRVVDSTTTNSRGRFRFRVELPDGEPTFFTLLHGDEEMSLIISPHEKIRVMSFGDLRGGYRVSGSAESELVWGIRTVLDRGAASLDSISSLLALSPPGDGRRNELIRAYYDMHLRTKRRQMRFIIENSGSLAAIYALYLRLPGDDVLFGGASDRAYYRLVADSLGKYHPDSPYVVAFKKRWNL